MILQLAYITLGLLMTLIIILMGVKIIRSTFDNTVEKKRKARYLIFSLLLWHAYIFLIAQTGILQDYSLPPKVPLLLVFPAFLFTGIFIYKNRNMDWIQNIPVHWLIFYQTFRILIEILFVYSIAAAVLHPNMTIAGYNFDMIFAASAPFIGFLILKRVNNIKRIVLWWNLFGLVVISSIIFVVVTTTYFPEFYGSNQPLMPKAFGQYPYVLVPAFLMPSAVFMHVLSIVQLRKIEKDVIDKSKSQTLMSTGFENL